MSEIRWCDPGSHAFSANDPDAQQFVSTRTREGGGRDVVDICGPHTKQGYGQILSITASADGSAIAKTKGDNRNASEE